MWANNNPPRNHAISSSNPWFVYWPQAVEQCLDSSTQVYMVMKEALANAVHDRMAADDNEPMQS
jgi:hypothetical protein